MALAITKENSVSTPKYLLSKKEMSEEEFHSLMTSHDKGIQSSYLDKPFSFSGGYNNNNTTQSHLKYNTESDNNHPITTTNNNDKDNNSKQSSRHNMDTEDKISNDMKQHYLRKEQKGQKETKEEYTKAIIEYKIQAESTANNQREIIDLQLNQKWQDNCNELLYECKAQEKNQKEKFLEEKMRERLEVQIRKELLISEYDKVVEKIRREVQQDIAKEFVQKKQREIELIKKKIEYSTQIKIAEYEKQLMQQYKESNAKEKKEIVEEKEKEIQALYKDKLIQMKDKVRKDLNEKYTAMNNDLVREINDMKTQYVIQSEKERKRLAKLNEMKLSCLQEEGKHKEKNKEINQLLTAYKKSDSNSQLRPNEFNQPVTMMRKCNSKSNMATRNLMMMNTNSNSDMIYNNSNNDKSINLFEVNNRIRYTSPRNEYQKCDDNYNDDNTSNKNNKNNKKNKGNEYNHFLIKK